MKFNEWTTPASIFVIAFFVCNYGLITKNVALSIGSILIEIVCIILCIKAITKLNNTERRLK